MNHQLTVILKKNIKLYTDNKTGTIILKYILVIDKEYSTYLNLFLVIGFCGGFTTFSAFSIDSVNLLNENKIIMLISYGLLSSVIGILFCYLGMNIIK